MKRSELRKVIKEELLKETFETKGNLYVIVSDEGFINEPQFPFWTNNFFEARLYRNEKYAQRSLEKYSPYWKKTPKNPRVGKLEIRLVK